MLHIVLAAMILAGGSHAPAAPVQAVNVKPVHPGTSFEQQQLQQSKMAERTQYCTRAYDVTTSTGQLVRRTIVFYGTPLTGCMMPPLGIPGVMPF